jgi:hypothetical protein
MIFMAPGHQYQGLGLMREEEMTMNDDCGRRPKGYFD